MTDGSAVDCAELTSERIEKDISNHVWNATIAYEFRDMR